MNAFFFKIIPPLFYMVLLVYIGTEVYYNQTYWRLVLRKKRLRRWDLLLWLERAAVLLLGTLSIFLAYWKE